MKTMNYGLILGSVALFAATSLGYAQRGVGDAAGVVQQQLAVERSTVSGTLIEVKDGPCTHTTGRSYIGMHYMLKTDDGAMINLHLGSSKAMKDMGLPTDVGAVVSASAFRTEKMKEDALTAIEVTVDGKTFVLRDANLKPVWSVEKRGGRGRFGRGR